MGQLAKLEGAIFADTQWEPQAVYDWIQDVLIPTAVPAGIPIYTVSKGNIRSDALRSKVQSAEYKKIDGGRWASMPLFTKLEGNDREGQIKRQCTSEYKITPIERFLKKQARGAFVRLWFGISGDEMRRMRISKERWKEHHYPLIFDFEKPLRRRDCLQWLSDHGFPQAPRSACLGCPYHSNEEWRQIRSNKEEWEDVVDFDAAIRSVGGLTAATYLHRSCVPLPMVDLSTPEERGQLNWLNECEGMCGV